MKRVLASSTCQDGDCPTFWQDDETGTVTVRGYSTRRRPLARLLRRRTEDDVTIPPAVWAHLVAQLK